MPSWRVSTGRGSDAVYAADRLRTEFGVLCFEVRVQARYADRTEWEWQPLAVLSPGRWQSVALVPPA